MSDDITFKQASRMDWQNAQSGPPSNEQIACGALQRIADATEKMAQSHDALIRDRDFWKRRAVSAEKALDTERRRSAALRGAAKRKRSPPTTPAPLVEHEK